MGGRLSKFKLALIIFIILLIAVGISEPEVENRNKDLVTGDKEVQEIILSGDEEIISQDYIISGDINTNEEEKINNNEEKQEVEEKDFSKIKDEELAKIPSYSNAPYYVVNNNVPFFNDADLVTNSYEKYGNLDSLKRCTTVIACIGKDIMPTKERGNIGSVKPTGWHTVKYSGIDGNYLYNRCHLIGYQLTAENANEKNLITGTRYMNVDGMLPFENMVADYIKETNNHVLYRVTPIFEGNNLLASGVLMEAKSVEDNGEGVLFNVYCYNVQPGIKIDYKTGESTGPEYTGATTNNTSKKEETTSSSKAVQNTKIEEDISNQNVTVSYILNTNTKKFHETNCSSVKQMSEKNKKEYSGNRNDLISQGYEPCGNCKP